jgi:hypothetical protein
MNLPLRKEKLHEGHRKHLIHSGTYYKQTQPEEFDLVILGGGNGEQQRTLPPLSEYAHLSGSPGFGDRMFR